MNPSAPATTSQQALQQLQTFQSGIKSPTDILKTQEDQLGVGAAQQQVSGLRQAINNTTSLLNQVAPGVQGRTQNSLVTAAQANRQIQNEEAPIASNLNKQTSDFGAANADLSSLQTQAQNRANAALAGQTQQQQLLQDIYDRLFQSEQAKAAQEFAAQQEAERIREFNASLKASSGGGFSFGGGGGTTAAAAGGGLSGKINVPGASPSTYQQAYNDVNTRVNSQDDRALQSDYVATASSARNGNLKDLAKLQIYRTLRPDLFKSVYSWEKTGGATAPVANPSKPAKSKGGLSSLSPLLGAFGL